MISGEGIEGAGCDIQEEGEAVIDIVTAGIGLAKYVFQLDGIDARGRAVLSKSLVAMMYNLVSMGMSI